MDQARRRQKLCVQLSFGVERSLAPEADGDLVFHFGENREQRLHASALLIILVLLVEDLISRRATLHLELLIRIVFGADHDGRLCEAAAHLRVFVALLVVDHELEDELALLEVKAIFAVGAEDDWVERHLGVLELPLVDSVALELGFNLHGVGEVLLLVRVKNSDSHGSLQDILVPESIFVVLGNGDTCGNF